MAIYDEEFTRAFVVWVAERLNLCGEQSLESWVEDVMKKVKSYGFNYEFSLAWEIGTTWALEEFIDDPDNVERIKSPDTEFAREFNELVVSLKIRKYARDSGLMARLNPPPLELGYGSTAIERSPAISGLPNSGVSYFPEPGSSTKIITG